MKISCFTVQEIPKVDQLVEFCTKETCVLVFPKAYLDAQKEKEILDHLRKSLPENHRIFRSGVWTVSITISIKRVISCAQIHRHIEAFYNALQCYIVLSEKLSRKDPSLLNDENWILVEEHGIHNRYEHVHTQQVLETTNYRMQNLEDLDPYFFGSFIKTHHKFPVLKELVMDPFHDCCKLIDFWTDDPASIQRIKELFTNSL